MQFKHDGRYHSSRLWQGAIGDLRPGGVVTYSLYHCQLDFNQSINQSINQSSVWNPKTNITLIRNCHNYTVLLGCQLRIRWFKYMIEWS